MEFCSPFFLFTLLKAEKRRKNQCTGVFINRPIYGIEEL